MLIQKFLSTFIVLLTILENISSFSHNYKSVILSNNSNVTDKDLSNFLKFVKKYGRKYTRKAMISERFDNFVKNSRDIERMNSESDGSVTYGINQFSDLTFEEYKNKMLSHFPSDAQSAAKPAPIPVGTKQYQNLPRNFDWRSKGIVTSVKHQIHCGSCWAFSAAAVLEGAYALKYRVLYDFSVQQLVDCTYANKNGCGGGNPLNAFEYAKKFALTSDYYYPYKDGYQGCPAVHPGVGHPIVSVKGSFYWPNNDEQQIANTLLIQGPLSIAADFSTKAAMHYAGGILTGQECEVLQSLTARHTVALVGYGIDDNSGVPFWTLKNSWGTNYGEQGYLRVKRGNHWCGLGSGLPNFQIVYPVVN